MGYCRHYNESSQPGIGQKILLHIEMLIGKSDTRQGEQACVSFLQVGTFAALHKKLRL